ncbi:MAG: FecR domain-containing protein [Cyclobacteriaceae bacterium]
MNQSTNDSELITRISRKLAGEATAEDLAILDTLVNKNEENRKLYQEMVRTWEETEKGNLFTAEETDAEWVRLRDAMREADSRGSSFSVLKIAASIGIIIAAGLTFLFLNQNKQTEILAQQVQTEILSDGSSITLNANAELTYPKEFPEAFREVRLIGEAFFEIERNPIKPFVIHTSSMDVTVLGTSFTVRSLETEETAEVVVATGSVKISAGGKTITLKTGERGILDKNSGQLFKVLNEDPNFMAWKTKRFSFDDVTLDVVIQVLNNAYQSTLYLRSSELANCPVTVSFEEKSLESILEVLKATLQLSVKETAKGTEISGEGC